MSISQVLSSDVGLTLLGTVFGGIWTLFKSSEWYARRRRRRFARALQVLETGVMQTYESYVRSLKQSREDGRLTDGERRRAREIARERALRIAGREGVDLLRELGGESLEHWIEKLVRKLKSG